MKYYFKKIYDFPQKLKYEILNRFISYGDVTELKTKISPNTP